MSVENNIPGIKRQSFKLTLNEDFFKNQDILKPSKYTIIDSKFIKTINYKWYHKILNFITLGRCFNRIDVYEVKLENE